MFATLLSGIVSARTKTWDSCWTRAGKSMDSWPSPACQWPNTSVSSLLGPARRVIWSLTAVHTLAVQCAGGGGGVGLAAGDVLPDLHDTSTRMATPRPRAVR